MQAEINTLLTTFGCALGVALLITLLIPRYQRAKRETIRRYRTGSQVIETPSGPLEYAVSGSGYPVIMLHGMGGGYDQGLLMSRLIDLTKYKVIAPSRPGHRRTPLATGPMSEEQADAISYLLDTLNVDKAIMVGLSGGGFAALQFALRFPERCKALILLSAHGPGTLRFLPPRILLRVLDVMAWADFPMWLMLKFPVQPMMTLEGSDLRRLRDPQNLEMAQTFMAGTFPPTDWKDGTFNDIKQLFALQDNPEWPLEQIKASTLVLHGKRDLIVRPMSARYHAKRIPSAQLTTFADGTHFMFITHRSEVREAIADFLQAHVATS